MILHIIISIRRRNCFTGIILTEFTFFAIYTSTVNISKAIITHI